MDQLCPYIRTNLWAGPTGAGAGIRGQAKLQGEHVLVDFLAIGSPCVQSSYTRALSLIHAHTQMQVQIS